MDVNGLLTKTPGVTAIAIKFGRLIRTRRAKQGLSQEALAELAGLNRSYLGEVERGAASASIDTLEKLATALGERLSDLLRDCEVDDTSPSRGGTPVA